MSKIIALGTASPDFCYTQQDILNYMLNRLPLNDEDVRKISLMYQRSSIEHRYSVLPDFLGTTENLLFDYSTASVEQRMQAYWQHAPALAQKALEKCMANVCEPSEITHLITVSCTGMAAPGLDLMLVQNLGLSPLIERTSVNFMGCYAAVHALKMADYIAKSAHNAVVAIVSVELCSLHFQPDTDFEQIAANLLFADGAAAAIIAPDHHLTKGLKIKGFYSQIVPEGRGDMAWSITQNGFLMNLSAYIPRLIKSGIGPLLHQALQKHSTAMEQIKHWAIHPGGRKILESVATELGLTHEDLQPSYKVLAHYGNMSSPTLLYVLYEIWQSPALLASHYIFGAAFGPGITLESALLCAE